MSQEEQELEIEALTSLFEEGKEFERISGTEFKLVLVPHPTGDEENHVGVTLHVTYTPEYPETAPEWELEDVKGLPDEKQNVLKGKVEDSINSSLGMAMIYQVTEDIKEYLLDNNVKELSMHEQMMQRLKEDGDEEEEDEEGDEDDEEGEEEEWKGLAAKALVPEDERISPDTFMAWKVKFDEEMIAAGVLRREETKAKTGKIIFCEGNLQGTTSTDKDGGPGGYPKGSGDAAGKGVLVYDAALFGEIEEEDDLDDLSADED